MNPSVRNRAAFARSGSTTTMPPCPGSMPVNRLMLEPWVTTTSVPGPFQSEISRARLPSIHPRDHG